MVFTNIQIICVILQPNGYAVVGSSRNEKEVSMTKNQIEYLKLLEQQRSNQADEALTRQRDANAHYVATGNLSENIRHNKASERANVIALGETQRHNQATERQNALSLDELSRHNIASETLTARAQQETERSHRASEALESERNAETKRSNLARETETHYSNMIEHHLRGQEIGLKRDTLAETIRENNLDDAYKRAVVSENTRANIARESETRRHNEEQEALQKTGNNIKIADTVIRGVDEAKDIVTEIVLPLMGKTKGGK